MEIINNPAIPFWSHIPGGADVGTVIKIDGHIPHHFDRFAINLMCGHEISHHAEHHNSIALHFNPRHYESCVVLNSRHYQEYGHEERKHHDWHAFHRGNTFSIAIHVEPEYYRINVNGNHFANFYHRLPLFEVKSLRIDGDIRVNFIEYRRENQFAIATSTVSYPTMPYPSAPPAPYVPTTSYVPTSPFVPQTVSYPVPVSPAYMPTTQYVPTAQPFVPVIQPQPTIIIEEGHHHHNRPGFIGSVIEDVFNPHHHHHHHRSHHW